MPFVNNPKFVGSSASLEEVVDYTQKYITKYAEHKGNYIFVYDNLHIGGYVNGGCYGKTGAWLGDPNNTKLGYNNMPKIVAFLDYNMKERSTVPAKLSEHERFYISWIVNESPFADAFMQKDVDVIYNQGNVLNVDISARAVVGGLMAMRNITDVRVIPFIMYHGQELVKKGLITNDQLFIIAHYLSTAQYVNYTSKFERDEFYVQPGAHSTGSFATLCNFTIKGWERFLKHEIVDKRKIRDRYYLQYTPVAGAWCKDSDDKWYRQIPDGFGTAMCPKTGRFLGAKSFKLKDIPSIADMFFSDKGIMKNSMYTPRFDNA